MTADPFDDVFRNSFAVTKESARALAAREILVLQTAAEILGLSLPLRRAVALDGILYVYVPTDTTSVHDGSAVLVSADGRRYKRVSPIDSISSAALATLLQATPLPIGAVSLGGPSKVLGSDETGASAALGGGDVAALLDTALGSQDWRSGSAGISLSSRVDYLPGNAWAGTVGTDSRLVMMGDGSIRAAGYGGSYVHGDPGLANWGTTRKIGVPATVTVAPGKIYHGPHCAYFVDSDGWPWSWGVNTYGVLGHGDTTSRTLPKRIEWFVTNNFRVASIFPVPPGDDADCTGTYFLEAGGTGRVAFAGSHANGAAGDSTTAGGNKTVPVLVGGGAPLTNITYLHACGSPITALARDAGGTWYGWGRNDQSCLGISGSNFVSPQTLTAMSGWVKAICSGWTTIALTTIGGGARTAGSNAYGNLGIGSTTAASGWQTPAGLATGVVDVGASEGTGPTLFAITEAVPGDRRIKTWGWNAEGSCGLGSTSIVNAPAEPGGVFQGSVVSAIAGGVDAGGGAYCSTFVRTATRIWGAGQNANNNLSIGITGNVSTFTEVVGHAGSIRDWAFSGYNNLTGLIVLTDRGCFSGGYNASGVAGIGPTLVNEAVLQPLWVPGVMGPQGPAGATGPTGPAADLNSILPGLQASVRNALDGQFPSFVHDVGRGVAMFNGAVIAEASGYSISTGSKRVIGSGGTLVTVAANTLAFDYSAGRRRLLVEGKAATNYVVSNDGTGAVAGTPGTLPTGWSYFSTSGLSTQVVGKGSALGIPYVDIRLFGTATATYVVLAMGAKSGVAAGDKLCTSAWLSLVGGSTAGIVASYIETRWPSGANTDTAVTLTATPTRVYAAGTNGATAGTAYPALYLNLTNGAAVDVTIRIGLPQLEAGLVPTSPIVTSGSAATRIGDDVRFSAAVLAIVTSGSGSTIALRGGLTDLSFALRVLGTATSVGAPLIIQSGSSVGSYDGSTLQGTPFGTGSWANFGAVAAISASSTKVCANGGLVATNGAMPTITGIRIYGDQWAQTNGWVDELAICPFVGSTGGIQAQARIYA